MHTKPNSKWDKRYTCLSIPGNTGFYPRDHIRVSHNWDMSLSRLLWTDIVKHIRSLSHTHTHRKQSLHHHISVAESMSIHLHTHTHIPAYWRCGGYPTNSMCVLGGWVTRMKRVWFSREGVTHTLATWGCARQSASLRHTLVPVTIFRTGMQAYCEERWRGAAWMEAWKYLILHWQIHPSAPRQELWRKMMLEKTGWLNLTLRHAGKIWLLKSFYV